MVPQSPWLQSVSRISNHICRAILNDLVYKNIEFSERLEKQA
jgi:hypothetical protein